tara:strand:+ start:1644 stop:2519 length:876 start_codon:yes stop_codon:yes gene_type:complete
MAAKPQSVPERSEAGRAALDIFYSGYNDVNFYVEDERQENFYFQIFQRHFPNVRIERIFPLSGKKSVIAHSKDPDNDSIRKRIYLLDKDFDDLLGENEEAESVFYLEKFCIENYLLDQCAFTELAIEGNPKLQRKDVEKSAAFAGIIDTTRESLRELFAIFYLVQREGLPIKNCNESPEKFCKPRSLWEVDPGLLESYRLKFNEHALEMGLAPVPANIKSDARLSEFWSRNADEVVSGKFVLHMIFHYLKKNYSMGSASFSSLAYRTCKSSELQLFAPVAQRIKVHLAIPE